MAKPLCQSFWARHARLVNRQWRFAADWVSLSSAVEQFAAHSPSLQDGLDLQVQGPAGRVILLKPARIRDLVRRRRQVPNFSEPSSR